MTNQLKNYAVALMLGMGMLGVNSAAHAGDDISVFSDIGGYSQYIWRGAAQGDGNFSLQGDVGIEHESGLSANVWFATLGLDSNDDTEYDITIDYSAEKDDIGYSVGYIHYAFIDNSFTADELYVSASYDFVSAFVAYDLDASDVYIELAASHSIEDVIDLSVSAGFNTYENFAVAASKDFDMGGYTLTPSIIIAEAKDADTEVAIGINASF